MYRRGYCPSTMQRQHNAEHYESVMSSSDKYRRHVDPNFMDPDGRNSIHLAVLQALHDTVHVNIDTMDGGAWSSAMDQSVQGGCDINAIDRWGYRPIHYAAEAGHLGSLRRLIRHGVDVNALTGPSTLQLNGSPNRADVIGLSPLMVAARRSKVEAVRFLLKNGAKASMTNSNGETALHYAASCTIHPEECINVLQNAGVKSPAVTALLNAQDSMGSTALMAAVRNKSASAALSAVQSLVASGADVSLTDNNDQTALHIAAQRNLPDVIDQLVKAGIDVDAADKEGHTSYVTAIMYDCPAALQSLIDAGCDRNSIDGLMGTAVGLAALKGHAKVVEILVRNGEDPDERAYCGTTPLLLATFEARVQVVDVLLRIGADPNNRSRNGCSALAGSMKKITPNNEAERHKILINLIRFGADVNSPGFLESPATSRQSYFQVSCASMTTGKGWLLSFAIDSGYVSFVRILVAAGSRLPPEEIRDRQLGSNNTSFFDNDELLKPIIDASFHPPSLQHFCRETVRKAVLTRCRSASSPHSVSGVPPCRIDDLIATLPIPTRCRHYLLFNELEDIPIERAQLVSTSNFSMFQMPAVNQQCGFSAARSMMKRVM